MTATLVTLAVVVSACSGGDDAQPPASTSSPPATTAPTLAPAPETSGDVAPTAFIPTGIVTNIDFTPSPTSPLAGWLTVTTIRPAAISGTLAAGGHILELAPSPAATEHRFPVVGLHPGERYRLTVTARRSNTDNRANAIIDTTALPDDFPPITATGQAGDGGWTVFAASSASRNNYLVALDATGTVAWYYRVTGGRPAAVYPTDAGLRYLAEPNYGREIDLLGTTVREWRARPAEAGEPDADHPIVTVDVDGMYRSLLELPSGSMATLSVTPTDVTYDESPCPAGQILENETTRVVADTLVTFDGVDGSAGLTWSTLDLYDPATVPGWGICTSASFLSRIPGAREWSLAGALSYDEETGAVIIPYRFLDAIVAVQAESGLFSPAGSVSWRFGLGQPIAPAEADAFSGVSSAVKTPDGLIAYDAGTNRAGRYSRSVEYEFDPVGSTAIRRWDYRRPTADGTARIQSTFGSIDILDDTTYLVVEGSRPPEVTNPDNPLETRASFVEVDRDRVVALEVVVGAPGESWVIDDAVRMPAPVPSDQP
ncbi:MAG: hypothetical protein HKN26_15855 [Acidimicrobiales bacterium]|nr:hypothetical protein [Acidimicrobiales bacterium]